MYSGIVHYLGTLVSGHDIATAVLCCEMQGAQIGHAQCDDMLHTPHDGRKNHHTWICCQTMMSNSQISFYPTFLNACHMSGSKWHAAHLQNQWKPELSTATNNCP